MTRSITPVELTRLMDSKKIIRIFDVRKPEDFASDPHLIPGAERKLPGEVGSWQEDVSPDDEVVVYCVHGHQVSQGVRDELIDIGFDAYIIEGGIEAWKDTGGATGPARI